ncbi:glycerol-3-phosphate 1-O-acyltransferase PlsY [Synechococcus sp. Cruz-9H2]|jgi:glycerol-3-phosphate acyltransferase PlsY|uniref:glycerol-3-phosphate 1-O-acyltransferase PlsY n=1 Tax=unclassified Synechococcus TaxID=2626047 RepID=UPI0020CBECB8|nr:MULTISPECIES: glycerol-3-phosphate 1-O-acyltransferase PlsY [unclassified Synechococcus]MCP9820436.1 glycerol-3-phosphate 1-O-acyltransferase PlsY [Synechococcus sp. Cruz-9H2]MCP9844701.1 glycerol-3-phosphate 1-O-acyltransferase PlsY [Synechococcus sp. Edmonson 11F2]MCP9856866.1 glycerol-3-phosphate 1-O-acyltransferase PlsY [Synechococcus sp. Cruz-9C9]MCP9864109.1 glycerol-3-phosphate 1-O-acyltransferase PlsY [Synechococcus sp. Cruz-7E5]MCP9871304.1 glycerol-3-phosphate 1-O-acyltransferase 
MSQPLLPLLVLAAGYLLGSLPTGWLAGRWLAGIDLRQLGSGSTGATNVLRQLGKGPALVVFLVDVLKGTAAVLLAKALLQPSGFTPGTDWWVVAAGLAALAGHIWPVWLGWKGGKAVATGLGMLLGLVPAVGLACFGTFLACLTISRIVSLSSVVAALSLPLLMLGAFAGAGTGLRPAYLALAVFTTVLVVWRHRSNLQRLQAGEEPRLGQKT